MEALAREGGLDPAESGEVEIVYEVADRDELLACSEFDVALLRLRGRVDDELIEEAIVAAAASQRRPDGSYRFNNVFRWLISRT